MADQQNDDNNDNDNNNTDWIYIYGKGAPPLTKARCNVRLLVEERYEQFYSAPTKSEERRAIVDEIMRIVTQQKGGQFLKKQADGTLLEVEPRIVRAHLQTMFSDKTRVVARATAARRQHQQQPAVALSSAAVPQEEEAPAARPPAAQLKDDRMVASEEKAPPGLQDASLDDDDDDDEESTGSDHNPVAAKRARLDRVMIASEKDIQPEKNTNEAVVTVSEHPPEAACAESVQHVATESCMDPPAVAAHEKEIDESAESSLSSNISERALSGREQHDHHDGDDVEEPAAADPAVNPPTTTVDPVVNSDNPRLDALRLLDFLPPLPLYGCHVESAVLQSQCDNSSSRLTPNSIYAVMQCKCDNPRCARMFTICQYGSHIACPFCNPDNRVIGSNDRGQQFVLANNNHPPNWNNAHHHHHLNAAGTGGGQGNIVYPPAAGNHGGVDNARRGNPNNNHHASRPERRTAAGANHCDDESSNKSVAPKRTTEDSQLPPRMNASSTRTADKMETDQDCNIMSDTCPEQSQTLPLRRAANHDDVHQQPSTGALVNNSNSKSIQRRRGHSSSRRKPSRSSPPLSEIAISVRPISATTTTNAGGAPPTSTASPSRTTTENSDNGFLGVLAAAVMTRDSTPDNQPRAALKRSLSEMSGPAKQQEPTSSSMDQQQQQPSGERSTQSSTIPPSS